MGRAGGLPGNEESEEGSHVLRRSFCVFAALALLFASARGRAEAVLPASLLQVDAYAFAGNTALQTVTLPQGALEIGDGAFQDCGNLSRVYIPATVEALGQDILTGCRDDVLVVTEYGSAAMEYARRGSLDYQADTCYRALLIGQIYETDEINRLYGTQNDLSAMRSVLNQFSTTPYQISSRCDLTGPEILNAVSVAFSGAKSSDVSLLYYTGHGKFSNDSELQGAFVGADMNSYVTATQLRAALDKIPGRKIVIIDACYSGAMLRGKSTRAENTQAMTAADFVSSFVSAFAMRSKGSLAGNGYFLLAAAAADEESYEIDYPDGFSIGLFTSYFAKACGWDAKAQALTPAYADTDGGGVLSLQEIYAYLAAPLSKYSQSVQVYPASCRWFGLLRR